jgi:16S rRNA (uracil1498-N3)-methyltransferase
MSQLQRIAITSSQLQSGEIFLTNEQQHYLGNVLRLHEGDKFIAMDGFGSGWLAQLKAEQAEILEPLQFKTELSASVTLMVALPKGNAFDDVVRECTEIGVSYIAPIISARTLLNPSPQKLERWRRIATEAAEQSERAFVPTILEPTSVVSFVNGDLSSSAHHKYICDARGDFPHLLSCLPKEQMTNEQQQISLIIATGPEGGWTGKELENAVNLGFEPVSLGKRILRAVTAPIFALSIVAAFFESEQI